MVKYLDDFFDWFLGFNEFLTSLKLMSLIQIFGAIATIALAIFAWMGLKTWKNQTRTQIHLKFIDDLNDAVNGYIMAMNYPVQLVWHLEIAIKSYTEVEISNGNEGENDGFIKYIERHGEETGKKLFEHLEKVRPFISKIRSLRTKGQIFNFSNYRETYHACEMLLLSHDLISGFAGLVGDPHMNWENELVKKNLTSFRNIKSSDIQKDLGKHNIVILKFSKEIYEQLLK
jgi:hypothetical protein